MALTSQGQEAGGRRAVPGGRRRGPERHTHGSHKLGFPYVDVQWLVKIKTASNGDVHYEEWKQPHGERTVLTKPTVPIKWKEVIERRNAATRYVLSAADYQRLVDAVKPAEE